MGKVKRESFKQNLRHLAPANVDQQFIINLVADVMDGNLQVEGLVREEIDLLEKAASALLRCARQAGGGEVTFQLRSMQLREFQVIGMATRSLQLNGRWQDRMLVAIIGGQAHFIAEPHFLAGEDFEDFRKLAVAGWQVDIDQRFASHNPTQRVAVRLLPPKRKSALQERLEAKAKKTPASKKV